MTDLTYKMMIIIFLPSSSIIDPIFLFISNMKYTIKRSKLKEYEKRKELVKNAVNEQRKKSNSIINFI